MIISKSNKVLISTIAIYVGTSVGAGIFGIPYAMAKFGFVPSLLYLIILAMAVLLVSLLYGEVALRTDEQHQIAGYAQKYLGKWGKGAITFVFFFAMYGSLLVHTIGAGKFLSGILSPFFGGTPFFYGVIFNVSANLIILMGLKTIAKVEFLLSGLFFPLVVVLLVISAPFIKISNLSAFHPENFFLPYGVILFALGALATVPVMKKNLESHGLQNKLKKAIVISAVIPVIIYFIFALTVVGVTGENTSQEGIIGLGEKVGGNILFLGSVFGFLTMATSFLILSFVLRESYQFDYKISPFWAWSLASFIPLAIFLLGLTDFIEAVSLIGSTVAGIQGITIILMWLKARKKGERPPEYSLKLAPPFIAFLILIFTFGIIYQIIRVSAFF